MRFRNELAEDDLALGFDQTTDLFSRRDLALRLTGLYEQLEHGSVSLLDGRWGTGKTTFVKQWAAELHSLNIPSIYFDAFASDYIDSPFQAIAATFVKAALEARRAEQPAYKTFLSKAAAVGKVIASTSAKVGVKAATLGVVNASDIGELTKMADVVIDGVSEITQEGVKRLLEEHATAQSQFAELRRSLEELPKLLMPVQEPEAVPPLVVFVDELDRCRPDFSLGILEVLKHFFRADGIHFVLVTNRSYLEMTVSHRYGVGESASEYLEKFYDFIVYFEQNYVKYDPSSATRFVNKVASGVIPESRSHNDIREYIEGFVTAYRLTLRQIQSFTTNVAISYMAASNNELRPDVLISFLAFLKTIVPDLYRKVKSGRLTWEEADELLKKGDWSGDEAERYSAVIRYHLDQNINVNDAEWRGWGESLWRYNIDRHKVLQYLANSVLDRFGAPSERKRMS